MRTLTVYGDGDVVLHTEEIEVGGESRSARRVTRHCGKLVLSTPGARVVLQTKRGLEDRVIVKKGDEYYTRAVRS
jgi:hypothetical protein